MKYEKCPICEEKLRNGVCPMCGYDFNRLGRSRILKDGHWDILTTDKKTSQPKYIHDEKRHPDFKNIKNTNTQSMLSLIHISGRLVHFTSKDLKKLEFKGDFWAPGIYTMFEMPEIFKMGDWWYLVFSEYSEGNKIHYRRSKNLYGPWEAPFDDAFDGRAYYAGRTAFDGERRVLFGWVPTRIDNDDKNAYLWGCLLYTSTWKCINRI